MGAHTSVTEFLCKAKEALVKHLNPYRIWGWDLADSLIPARGTEVKLRRFPLPLDSWENPEVKETNENCVQCYWG